MTTERMVYGCPHCMAIFTPDFLYLEQVGHEEFLFCPNCGKDTDDLGYAPQTTEKEGLWFLTDGDNVMGPYPDGDAAQKDLWAWFGGREVPHAEEGDQEEGTQGQVG